MKQMNLMFWVLMLGSVFALTSCSDDDDNEPDTSSQTIAEIVQDDSRFSILLGALERTNLASVLAQDGPYTVFAPTNDAFDGIDLNALSDAQLSNILLYHVLGAKVKSTDLAEGQTYTNTASKGGYNNTSPSALIERSGSTVTINGKINVTTADVEAANGVIHIVDGVMMPMNVVEIASSNGSFSRLVGAIGAASGELGTVLSGTGPFTVFAPLDAAFQAIDGTVGGLTADQLAKVLTYHVVGGNIASGDLAADQDVATVNSENINIKKSGSNVTVTDAKGNVAEVVLADVQGTNGIVHVINMVLIPETL